MRTKIGLCDVEKLPPNSVLWDEKITGLCARRQHSELVTYSVIYRNKDNAQKWFKLGHHPVLTPSMARQEAVKILRSVTLGADPSDQRHEARHSATIAQLCADYSADMQSGKINGKKISTIKTDISRIEQHIKPKLGKLKVATISSEQVEEFMNSLTAGSAKRIIGLLGAIFSYAIKRKMRPNNPVQGIETPSDVKRMRRLSNGEYQQLSAALSTAKLHQTAKDIFSMLAVTGWRSGEVKNLKWAELDIERRIAILGDTKTGVSVRPLSSAAVDIINRQQKSVVVEISATTGANGVYENMAVSLLGI